MQSAKKQYERLRDVAGPGTYQIWRQAKTTEIANASLSRLGLQLAIDGWNE